MEQIKDGAEETKSLDLVNDNINKLRELFPEIVTEGKIDFKVLQEILGEELEEGEEYYRFTWAGKAQARREAHKPSTGTLRPCKEESVDWDTTQNLYIEGDNLEVLKLMQKSYANKVKMIYIDPPYNTGKDFVYKDNYKDNLKNYQQVTGQVDNEGNKLSTNSESDGRYHSNWLNMMYPRLRLARNLLKEDGVIFISIDDNEMPSLRLLCNDAFGELNFLGQITWQSTQKNDPKYIAINHEYVLVYAKNKESLPNKWRVIHPLANDFQNLYDFLKIKFKGNLEEMRKELLIELKKEKYDGLRHYKCIDEKGIYFPADISDPQGNGPKHDFVVHPITGEVCKPPTGGYSPREEEMKRRLANDEIHFGDTHEKVVCYKKYVSTAEDRLNSVYYEDGRRCSKMLKEMFGGKKVFDFPKSEIFLKRILMFATEKDDVIIDFFSGSASTAHAIMQLNSEDGGNRKHIQVQLPEPTDEKSEAFKAGYITIAEIGKERIRRAGKKIAEENPDKAKDLDLGFKVFKLDSSNIKGWDGNPEDLEASLFDAQENIKADRTEEDVLFEILLKYGLDLTLPIEEKTMEGKKVFNVGFGALFICLADGITNKVAEGIGAWKQELNPATCRVIFKDSGFTDVEKANAVQTLKRFGINEVKSI